jgi:fructuronate reductase
VQLPGYDRSALKPGIVHLGLGAFHRAHQAVFTEDAIASGGGNWGIIGVSMRGDTVARQLRPQQNLYSVMSEDAGGYALRVVGVLCDVLVAPQQLDAAVNAIADPATKIITLTITEKGYELAADGLSLDANSPAIKRDLAQPEMPRTAVGLLALGLLRRFQAGGMALTIISCDNLSENSARLRGVLEDYLAASFPEVRPWLRQSVAFPCSMVDRIVPASDETHLQRQGLLLGVDDQAAVRTEPFSQWIIENNFATPIPTWPAAGVQLVEDIRPFEAIKLRLLNASHSAIAYSGLLAGKETVDEVMAEPLLRTFIEQLMARELMPTLEVPGSFDLAQYREALLVRFSNPRLQHRCAQIAMDGSAKIAQRWLPGLPAAIRDGLLVKALSCWVYFVLETDLPLCDPQAERLLALRGTDAPQRARVAGVLGCAGISEASLQDFETLCQNITANLALLSTGGIAALLTA